MTKKQKDLIILVIVIMAILIVTTYFESNKITPVESTNQIASTSVDSDLSVATSTMQSSTSTVSNATSPAVTSTTSTQKTVMLSEPFLLYSVTTDKSTYTQAEQINITLSVLNNSNIPRTFDFSNGCQGTYTIDAFNMLQHTRCLPGPSSFTLAPHGVGTIPLVNYPSVDKLPVGTSTIFASLVGYGGATTTVTITN